MSKYSEMILHRVPIAMIIFWTGCTAFSLIHPFDAFANPATYLETVALVVFGLIHASRRLGAKSAFVMFAIAFMVSNIAENLSISTGFPFGYYVHSEGMGPTLLLVPIIIGPIYFGVCYLTWTLATMLLGEPDSRNDWRFSLSAPIVATFIVVGFDLCLDPMGSTIGRQWVYPHGGAYFGVPFSNYVGWFITSWVIFQGFGILSAVTRPPPRPVTLSYWYEAATFWALMGLQFPAMLLFSPQSITVQDMSGWNWRSNDIQQVAAIMSVYTMLAAAITSALVVTLRSASKRRHSS